MTTIAKPKAIGVGLVALDLVQGPDDQVPTRAMTGGTCGNVLSILAYLGWESYPVARLGTDCAAERVRADLAHWGVRLDFLTCGPAAATPMVVQQIRKRRDGSPSHRFSWHCPNCGHWLPSFKAVTLEAVERVAPTIAGSSVFFMDRLSRASLTLASRASEAGAVVVFEPAGKGDDKLFAEALQIAHVVKYADDRLHAAAELMRSGSPMLLEVHTLGSRGLRYRHRLGRGISGWTDLDAIPASSFLDACGAGDWCTAGVLAKAAVGGQVAMRRLGAPGINAALRFGQALASWNCQFEGARGGMYGIERGALERSVKALLSGEASVPTIQKAQPAAAVLCPACPQTSTRPESQPVNEAERIRRPSARVRKKGRSLQRTVASLTR